MIQLTLSQQAQQFVSLQQQQQSSQDNTSDIEMQSTSSTNIPQLVAASGGGDKTAPSTPSAIRNRRTLSGSGQTISQHTRDRLKNMIATKKQKQQRLGSSSSSSGSQTNLAPTTTNGTSTTSASSAGTGSLTWIPPNNPETNLIQQLAAAAIQQSARHSTNTPTSTTGTSHFEPYPLPSSANVHASQMSEFQLRKVNSEPNLKMRLRARLLNKGSSPQQQQQSTTPAQPAPSLTPQSASTIPQGVNGNPFLPPSSTPQHRQLQRCDSDSLQFENLLGSPVETPLAQAVSTTQLPFPANLMIPSPSLPNLCMGLDQLQLDYTNLMLQSAFTSFLSMPSLLKTQLITNSIVEPQQVNDDQSGKCLLSAQTNVRYPFEELAPSKFAKFSTLKCKHQFYISMKKLVPWKMLHDNCKLFAKKI